MISKYNGTCCYCKQPTKANVDEYELDSKKSFHVACKEADEAQPSPEQFSLAERLGFIEYRQDMAADGLLRSMSPKNGGSSTGRIEPETHRGPEPSLRFNDEIDCGWPPDVKD